MEKFKNKDLKELRALIEEGDHEKLSAFIGLFQPIDFAEMVGELDDTETAGLCALLEEDELASLMEQAEDKERIRIAKTLNDERLLSAMEYMQKDDIVDMLGDFPIGRRKQVIRLMKNSDRQIITKLLQYPEDSAGGLMTTDYIALREDFTVYDGLKKIREISPKTEMIETIYVINASRQLIGCIDLRKLLTARKDTVIGTIMDDQVISVLPETDQEEAAHLVSRYDLNAIPVVSNSKQILGIITVDDVIDVIVEEYDEDMLQMAGVNAEENLESTWKESLRMRLPWLLVNLATAFLASFTVSLFQGTISKVVALSAVMTIISGMGGNAGTQTMSILVRALSQQDISWQDALRPLGKELTVGVLNGAACGVVTSVVVYFMYRNAFLSLIVIMAMVGNLIVSAFFGFLVPVVLKKMHADPAVASSIFVTTATDVLGFFIFLGLAQLFLPFIAGV
uniref:magnesium transporter n=1 Tax=Eubacterium cellulosolvens TaxID=29322 RepID=UPI0004805428|nr:magnesium transporter [[Eubacterium] cellulosolvens]